MDLELWESRDLYQSIRDERLDEMPDHFLTTYFGGTPHYSNDKKIWLRQLPAASRQMAPFVLPTMQGKPIFNRKGETAEFFEPPYIKPKDAVRPEDSRTALPDEIFGAAPRTPQQRFDDRTLEVAAFHKRAIQMQECWMAARAFIDGKVTIKYEPDQGAAYPEVTIDFGRAAGHTQVLTTDFWDNVDYPIMDDLQEWGNTMRAALNGGFPTQLYVGANVAPWIAKNKQVLSQMDTTIRGNNVQVSTGIMNFAEPLTRIGDLSGGITAWCYKDTVEDQDHNLIDILDPNDVLLVAPGARGVRAYGAIYDVDAFQTGQSAAIDIFSKQFKTNDPGELFLMSQSAPLPIMLYPNRTFKATVFED